MTINPNFIFILLAFKGKIRSFARQWIQILYENRNFFNTS